MVRLSRSTRFRTIAVEEVRACRHGKAILPLPQGTVQIRRRDRRVRAAMTVFPLGEAARRRGVARYRTQSPTPCSRTGRAARRRLPDRHDRSIRSAGVAHGPFTSRRAMCGDVHRTQVPFVRPANAPTPSVIGTLTCSNSPRSSTTGNATRPAWVTSPQPGTLMTKSPHHHGDTNLHIPVSTNPGHVQYCSDPVGRLLDAYATGGILC